MNSSHGYAAGGGGVLGAAVVGVLVEQFHLSATLASNWVIISSALAVSGLGLVVWFVKWKWPDAPPLPGELVEVPPGQQSVQVAQVQAQQPTTSVPVPASTSAPPQGT
jgi:hypothetical protein